MEDNKISSGNFCGGPLGCENREYDHTKSDCAECYKDAVAAMSEVAYKDRISIELLKSIERHLPFDDPDAWNSLDVTYHPPRVERLWMQVGENRVFLHCIHPCTVLEALIHPHPWQSAVHLIAGGEYEHGLFYRPGDYAVMVSRQILSNDSYYEMIEKDALHYVRPIDEPVYTIMITGPAIWPDNKEPETKAAGKMPELSAERKLEILNIFKNNNT